MTEIPSPLPFDNSYVIEQVLLLGATTIEKRKTRSKKSMYRDILKEYDKESQYVETLFGPYSSKQYLKSAKAKISKNYKARLL